MDGYGTLAKQIERQMHGVWKHCMIRDEELERIWLVHGEDRGRKDRSICDKIWIPSEVLSKGNVHPLRQMAAGAAHLSAIRPFLTTAYGFGSRIDSPPSSPRRGESGVESSRRQSSDTAPNLTTTKATRT